MDSRCERMWNVNMCLLVCVCVRDRKVRLCVSCAKLCVALALSLSLFILPIFSSPCLLYVFQANRIWVHWIHKCTPFPDQMIYNCWYSMGKRFVRSYLCIFLHPTKNPKNVKNSSHLDSFNPFWDSVLFWGCTFSLFMWRKKIASNAHMPGETAKSDHKLTIATCC